MSGCREGDEEERSRSSTGVRDEKKRKGWIETEMFPVPPRGVAALSNRMMARGSRVVGRYRGRGAGEGN